MSEPLVAVDTDGDVATIRLDRPSVRNALSVPLVEALLAAVDEVEAAAVRAVVLHGADGTFCAGGDLEQPPAAFVEEVRLTNRLILRMRRSGLPFVAAVEGAAVGGGFELALGCDLRVAAEDATLGLPEVSVGIFPCAGGTRLLAREVGAATAREIVLTGAMLSAAEADEAGLLADVTAPEACVETASALAAEVAAHSPVAVTAAKRSLADAFDRPLPAGLALDERLAARVARSADFAEGTAAFLEGREPEFPGH